MLRNRYRFIKRLYPNYIVIFMIKKKYYLVEEQMRFLKFFKKKNIIKTLEFYNINYIIMDNLTIIKRKEYTNNKYLELLKKGIIIQMIDIYYTRIEGR